MKKNKIFKNKVDNRLGNNQKSFNITEQGDINEKIIENDTLSINEKIEKLFNRNGYIFNVNVKIITDNREYDTKIAGKVNNHLITLDNDIIAINDIKNIIIKD